VFPLKSTLAATPLVRRDVDNMNMPTIRCWSRTAKGIKAMQALPNNNPLSWAYQGAIHWTTLPPPLLTSWDNCGHGTDFFWSWHRMYLYWFERIIRKFSGAPGTELQLPAPFRDTTSEIYTVNRDPLMNSGAASLPPGAGDLTSTEVNEYCYRRFPIWLYVRELVLQLRIPPVELNQGPAGVENMRASGGDRAREASLSVPANGKPHP
jgi:hypothetical protein